MFSKKQNPAGAANAAGATPQQQQSEGGAQRIMGRNAYCRICGADRQFSKCWLRVKPVAKCSCCGTAFADPAAVYAQVQPVCPRCEEPLESPGFEYGLCDGCGSKFELVQGTRPSLLPNKNQRAEMNKVGRSRSK
ncbi:MAG: hypothetical protein JXR94_15980 [Candidatus Hydrogenedentes bacterium]|nr:hypothetical protein [Candidatus Hydrogenedentota bacterium]